MCSGGCLEFALGISFTRAACSSEGFQSSCIRVLFAKCYAAPPSAAAAHCVRHPGISKAEAASTLHSASGDGTPPSARSPVPNNSHRATGRLEQAGTEQWESLCRCKLDAAVVGSVRYAETT